MKLVNLTAAAAIALGVLSAGVAQAETLKVSCFLPPNHTFNKVLTQWGEELKQKTGGKLDIELFPAGQLGPPNRQFQLVTSGAADVAVILVSATPGRFTMSELAGEPLVFPAGGKDKDSAATSRRLTELAPKFLAKEYAGTHILWMAVTPPLKLHLRSVNPENLSVFKGLKIRYAGTIWQQMLEAMGAAPVPVPPAETVDAMSKGVVDGAAFPYEATKSFDLGPVTKYSMEPGLSSAAFAVVMSDAAYNRLTPDMQKLVDETTGPQLAASFGKAWDAAEADGRQYMIDSGVTIVTLKDDQIAKLNTLFKPIVDDAVKVVADTGKPAAEFLSAYTK